MILILVIVVDNNFRILIVAAAILEDETEATFVWHILQELKNTCDVMPTALYSDTDPALISAVRKNYPETKHFHCIFHIDLNLRKKLKGSKKEN